MPFKPAVGVYAGPTNALASTDAFPAHRKEVIERIQRNRPAPLTQQKGDNAGHVTGWSGVHRLRNQTLEAMPGTPEAVVPEIFAILISARRAFFPPKVNLPTYNGLRA